MPRPASPSPAVNPVLYVDRSGAERDDDLLLDRVLTDSRTRVLAVRRDAAPLVDGRLGFVGLEDLAGSVGPGPVAARPADTSSGGLPVAERPAGTSSGGLPVAERPSDTVRDRPRGEVPPVEHVDVATVRVDSSRTPDRPSVSGVGEWAFLGRDGDGRAVVLAVVGDDAADDIVPGAVWASLRAAGGDLPDGEAEVLTTAVALAGWLRDAPFCPACGSPTQVRHAGWSRHCPSCGREHFPRTDPAVIVLVTSADSDDRILLGANAAWGGQRYSCFAGFAEAGESLEDAVVREVGEEAGVGLRDLVYQGSQAWPYPRSLMLGFRAAVVADADARPDGEEILEVRWFTRDEVGAALRGEAEVQLPGAASIAHRLIDDWYRGVA